MSISQLTLHVEDEARRLDLLAEQIGFELLSAGFIKMTDTSSYPLMPANQSGVRSGPDDNIRDSVAIHQRTHFAMRVGYADGNELQVGNLHRG